MTDIAAVSNLAVLLGEALGGSDVFFADFHTDDLGVALPDAVIVDQAVVIALGHAATAATTMRTASTELAAAAAGDEASHLLALTAFGAALTAYFAALANLVVAIDGAITPATIPDAAERAAAQGLIGTLAKRLADVIAGKALSDSLPELMLALKILGLAEWGHRPSDETTDLSTSHVAHQLRLDRLKDLFSDPGGHLANAHGWGTPNFDPIDFFRIYAQLHVVARAAEVGVEAGDSFMRRGDMKIRRDSSVAPPGLRIEWGTEYGFGDEQRLEISDDWGATIAGSLTVGPGASALIEAPLSIQVTTSSDVSGSVRLFVDRNDGADPIDLLGGTGLLSITLDNAAIGVGIEADWNSSTQVATFDALLFAALEGATLVIGTGESDSFIGELLSGANVSGTFDVTAEWSATHGLRVRGSGGFEIRLPVHKSIGPVTLDSLYLALRIASDGTLQLETSAAITGKFGPLSAAVDRMGATLDVRFVDDAAATFGPFDLHLGFKPPSGVGLAIDAGVVKGGGYLYFDPANEEYAGALELVLLDFVTVKAIGLITTRLPDGSKGFSLLLIITAEFGTGIQLGFGFTLIGVGGLLGLNRTMRLQALMEGVRTGAIQSVMFPTDVVANAPRIISDLRAFFPPAKGIFLIGPMAKIGWGTPPLITLSLGVIIEIPGNIAILGVLRVVLPDEQAALIKLQVNFVGAIEFDKQRAWFFAGLFESRILYTTIEGEMGLLISWGADANFVVSVGGFHPQYQPPPLPFNGLQRITNNILNAAYGRIRILGYFAVTSNSVQFGAQAELFFGISVASIEGHIGFDALFQFNPFYLLVEISASVDVKLFGAGLFGISLRFTLEGPTPWRATGYGKIKLLFWSKKISFDFTWGEARDTTLPPIAVMPMLVAEYAKVENWQARVPSAHSIGVSLRALPEGSGSLVLHPLGRLAVSQRAVPLDLDLAKVGNRKPSDAKRFNLSIAGGLSKTGDVDESFAIGQFQELDDAAKLSTPAFQPLAGGLEAAPSGRDIRTGNATKRNIRYETVIIDRQRARTRLDLTGYPGSLFFHFLGGNAASRSIASQQRNDQLAPFAEKITVGGDSYVVASTDTNAAYAPEAVFSSQAQAETYLADEMARDPALAGSLHVIPGFELTAAP